MSVAEYWQRGETIDYTNSGTTDIAANEIVVLGSRIGVAGTVIPAGELGSLIMTGVFEMPKTDTTEITAGVDVYFDGDGITATSTDNTPAGYAVQTAAAADTVVYVKLLG